MFSKKGAKNKCCTAQCPWVSRGIYRPVNNFTLHLYQGEQSVKTSNDFFKNKNKSSKRQKVIDYVLDQKTRLH